MKVLLIRHGETDLQARKCYQGTIDVPLSQEGRRKLQAGRSKQAKESGKPFGEPAGSGGSVCLCPGEAIHPARVYVSPLKRARETAGILFPQAEQIVVPGLREMDFGSFEGRSYMDMEKDPDYRAWVDGMCLGPCPGGESREEHCTRTCRAFEEVLHQARMRGETSVVIVAHGGTQMAVLDRYAERNAGEPEDKLPDYYGWQLPCACGYILEAAFPEEAGQERLPQPSLHVLGTCSFTE